MLAIEMVFLISTGGRILLLAFGLLNIIAWVLMDFS
jgi:hypothetical protein